MKNILLKFNYSYGNLDILLAHRDCNCFQMDQFVHCNGCFILRDKDCAVSFFIIFLSINFTVNVKNSCPVYKYFVLSLNIVVVYAHGYFLQEI